MPFNLLDRLNKHFNQFADRPAFYIGNNFFTYSEFKACISAIQQKIKHAGDEIYIGLITHDDIETYATIYALWYMGKAYVPLNPDNPADRNRSILDQTGIKTVISSRELNDEADGLLKGRAFIHSGLNNPVDKGIITWEAPDDADCYVIFTSGSTGKPKGVPINRRNLGTFVESFTAAGYKLSEADRFLQIYDLTFDASVHCYTLPLWVGGCVYTVPRDQIKYLYAYKLMSEQKLTFVKMPPSTLSYLQPYFGKIKLEHLRYCLLGGEAFSSILAEKWSPSVPNAQIQNVYGPTEATINSHIYNWEKELNVEKSFNGIVSIGKCFGDNEAIVIDEKGSILGENEKGELCLSGSQVTTGYWQNERQTASSFFKLKGKRYYRTGDLVVRDLDGDYLYLGRLDSQVQVQGYRVELGEIENHARNWLDQGNVAAVARTNDMNITEIYLFIENSEGKEQQLTEFLDKQLPYYMLPKRVINIQLFPKSAGGKINKSELINNYIDAGL